MSKKSSSIKLIEKPFKSKEKGSFQSRTAQYKLIFLELYLAKKFTNLLYYLPFIELGLLDDQIQNKIKFGIIDYNKDVLYISEKNEFNPNVFKDYFKEYKDTKKRFTLFVVQQQTISNKCIDYHSIVFLYDKKYNELELFDSSNQNFQKFKSFIKKFFTAIYGDKLKIFYPYFQKPFGIIEDDKCNDFLYTSSGFCVAWSLWYIEYRLTNVNKSRNIVLKNAIKEFKKGDKICRVIRGYAMFIDKFVKYYKLDVNKYKGVVKIIDTRTNKKYNIPLKMISLLGLTAAILYMIKKLNFGFKRV